MPRSFGSNDASPTASLRLAGVPNAIERVGALERERAWLDRELLRCQDQLRLVRAVTNQVSTAEDHAQIRQVLLQRFAVLSRAGALFLDTAGCCARIKLERRTGARVGCHPQVLRAALGDEIEAVRHARRGRIPVLSSDQLRILCGASVLLSAFCEPGGDVGVLISLRAVGEPPYDPRDLQASDAVLTFGVQLLSTSAHMREVQRTVLETVCALVNAIDAKDNYTSDHSERVGSLARLTGEAIGLSSREMQMLEWAGLLHDVGKIGVPEHILNKPGVLTAEEAREMKRHPRIGHDMLKPVAQFGPVLDAILYHHENHDGTGYPDGLAGDEIPIDARIVHVADIFDALTTHRPYRRAYSYEHALRLLEVGAGRITDPDVTHVFAEHVRLYMQQDPETFYVRVGSTAEPGALPFDAACEARAARDGLAVPEDPP